MTALLTPALAHEWLDAQPTPLTAPEGDARGPWQRRLVEAAALLARPAVLAWLEGARSAMPRTGMPDLADPAAVFEWRGYAPDGSQSAIARPCINAAPEHLLMPAPTGRVFVALELPPDKIGLPPVLVEACDGPLLHAALKDQLDGSFAWPIVQGLDTYLESRSDAWAREIFAARLNQSLDRPAPRTRVRRI